MDGRRPEDAFGWLYDSCLSQGGCVTFIEGDDVEHAAAAFGGRLDHAQGIEGVRPLAEALSVVAERIPGAGIGEDGLPVALFARRDGMVAAFEWNGGQGIHAEVLERASRFSRAVSVFWNVNMLTHFGFAEGGRLLAEFSDGALGSVHGADPVRIDAAVKGLGWENTLGAMFALAARLTAAPRGSASPARCSRAAAARAGSVLRWFSAFSISPAKGARSSSSLSSATLIFGPGWPPRRGCKCRLQDFGISRVFSSGSGAGLDHGEKRSAGSRHRAAAGIRQKWVRGQ